MTISTDVVRAAADAVAAALPVPATLRSGVPVPASEFASASAFPLPLDPGAAVVCRVEATAGSPLTGDLAVIVDGELVHALATSPLGALDVAQAVQPALDAAASAVAGTAASLAQQFTVDAALETLLARPGAVVVPLTDPFDLVIATLVIALEDTTVQTPSFVQAGTPAAVSADAQVPTRSVPVPRQPGAAEAARLGAAARSGLDLLRDVAMEITVELGRTRMTVRELLSLTPGAVVELDRAAGSPADLLVNGTLIARGEVVVVDEDFGIRITEIVASGGDLTAPTATRGPGAA